MNLRSLTGTAGLAVAICIAISGFAAALTVDWVTIGDPGNFGGPETFGRVFGAVPYAYRISRFEVTNREYAEFLNMRDPNGSNSLSLYNSNMANDANGGILLNSAAQVGSKFEVKPGYQEHPVNFVSWFDAVRFANWMNNGQGNADTETGSYTLTGGTATPSNAITITRNSDAVVALPTEDEWYKAAYYDTNKDGEPGYWTYPTAADVAPTSSFPTAAPNAANIIGNGFAKTPGQGASGSDIVPGIDYLTDVGSYSSSASASGTFDQAGNVWEWNESIINIPGPAGVRGNMGGSFYNNANLTTNLGWAASNAYVQENGLGFRLIRLGPLPGDFNADGSVDAADYVTWRDNFGAPTEVPIQNAGDGLNGVDAQDYAVWKGSFGHDSETATSTTVAVPEPCTWVMSLFALLAILTPRFSRGYEFIRQHSQMVRWVSLASMIGVTLAFSTSANGLTMDWVSVGDVGNYDGPETWNGQTYGGVDHFYRIGKYEVTNSQYVEFLNGKDPQGANPFSLYNTNMTSHATGGILFNPSGELGAKYSAKPGQGNHPVNYVSWFDSLRFINWLNNGQANSDTESGAYTLLGGTPTPSNARTIERNPGAIIALPSEDEWYKAAYFDPTRADNGGYWIYPTRSDQVPLSAPPSNTSNSANIRGNGFALTPGEGTGGTDIKPTVDYLTDVGAYSASPSYYGTFDQAGNVIEWHEQFLMPWNENPAGVRGVRGAAFHNEDSFANMNGGAASTASVQSVGQGFRVVNLAPQPGDFNNDGKVDAADYVTWRDNLGATTEVPIQNAGDGLNGVDAQDFAVWKATFGNGPSPGSPAVGSTVPEPNSFWLCCLVAVLTAISQRRLN